MGTPRPSDSGRVDAVGRPIKVSAADADARSTAPAPPATRQPPAYGDQGWTYRRNGIGGRPFLASINDDGDLEVAFLGRSRSDTFDQPITIPAALIGGAAAEPVRATVGKLPFRAAISGRFGLTAFDVAPQGTMIAVTDLDADDNDYATAAFTAAQIAGGDVAQHAWRGDLWHRACLEALRDPNFGLER